MPEDKLVSKNIRTLVPTGACIRRWDIDGVGPWAEEMERESSASHPRKRKPPVEISFSPVKTEEGVVITRDSRHHRAQESREEIRQLNLNLEERVLERTEALMRSNEELRQFAYIASHDLQEPLRTVSIFANFWETLPGQLQGTPTSSSADRGERGSWRSHP
jgi:signal transduction histidine kinase